MSGIIPCSPSVSFGVLVIACADAGADTALVDSRDVTVVDGLALGMLLFFPESSSPGDVSVNDVLVADVEADGDDMISPELLSFNSTFS